MYFKGRQDKNRAFRKPPCIRQNCTLYILTQTCILACPKGIMEMPKGLYYSSSLILPTKHGAVFI